MMFMMTLINTVFNDFQLKRTSERNFLKFKKLGNPKEIKYSFKSRFILQFTCMMSLAKYEIEFLILFASAWKNEI